ncbi:MAG: GWxTD domain-containing protein [Calditrichaeota bacterium]|nr:GWxTD domain-containing protein [Calditrichota bacterium]
MKLKQIFWTFLINLLLLATVGFSQILPRGLGFKKNADMFGPGLFLYHVSEFRSEKDPEMSRLNIEVVFANDILQFVKKRTGGFSARYDLVVSLFDRKDNLVDEKSAYESIAVKEFEETNSRKLSNRHRFSFYVRPGKYRLLINLTDEDTQKSLHREKKIAVKGFLTREAFISDIVFADKIEIDSTGINIIDVNVTRRFFNPDSAFWAYFEIYPRSLTDSLLLRYSIFDREKKRIALKKQSFIPNSKRIPYLIDLSKFIDSTGQYTLMVYVSQGKIAKNLSIQFSAVWRNASLAKMNTSMMLRTMREYIPGDDYKFLKNASDSTRKAYFQKYWKKRDPTPETERNELLEEFTRRVEFANNYFSVHGLNIEGWQTDRGKIYVKYGPPTQVDRRMDEIDLPPYEIWYYQQLQRRFIFEDKSGSGDFKLVRIE